MIRMFLQEKGHYLTKEAMADGKRLFGANVALVDAYVDRLGPGPSHEDPRFAWECSATHPWNRKVVSILAANFKIYASTTGITQLVKLLRVDKEGGMTADYGAALDKITDIEVVIADKLTDQQRRYRTLIRKAGSLSGLSELEVKETLKSNLRTSQKASRRNERKRNVGEFASSMFKFRYVTLIPEISSQGNNHWRATGSGHIITYEHTILARLRFNFFAPSGRRYVLR